eukprot:UN14370
MYLVISRTCSQHALSEVVQRAEIDFLEQFLHKNCMELPVSQKVFVISNIIFWLISNIKDENVSNI